MAMTKSGTHRSSQKKCQVITRGLSKRLTRARIQRVTVDAIKRVPRCVGY